MQPYEIFEWDTYFGALMLSFDPAAGLPLALSSLIQVTKGKTLGPRLDGKGFVPGYSKGGAPVQTAVLQQTSCRIESCTSLIAGWWCCQKHHKECTGALCCNRKLRTESSAG